MTETTATSVLAEGAPAPAAETAKAGTTTENAAWYSGIQNETVRTWAEAKGFKDPHAVAESAYNLEKLIGFDRAGRTIVVPGENASAEEMAAFRSKIGVPDKAEAYQLPVPEGDDGAFAKSASAWMHEAGVPAAAAQKLAAKWNEHVAAQNTAQEEAFNAQATQGLDKIRTEWGAAYDQNIELSKRAARQFLPAETPEARGELMDKIERAMGTETFLRMFAKIGEGLAEHKMQGGGDGGLILSPAQAKQRIEELKSNKEWAASYLSGDKGKIVEMTRLQKLAFPQE